MYLLINEITYACTDLNIKSIVPMKFIYIIIFLVICIFFISKNSAFVSV